MTGWSYDLRDSHDMISPMAVLAEESARADTGCRLPEAAAHAEVA